MSVNGSPAPQEAIADAERAARDAQDTQPPVYVPPLTPARLQALIAAAEHEAHVDIRALRIVNATLTTELNAVQQRQKDLQAEYQRANAEFIEREATRCAQIDAWTAALGEGSGQE